MARERFGITRFRPGQRELLAAVFSGRDAVGILPTGAGKSLCFQLPALFLPKPVVVVSPLISLMQDQQEKLSERAIEAAKINSTLTDAEEREAAAGIRDGSPEVIFVTPERLENQEYLAILAQGGASLFVIDEAHCISTWGHDFRPAYLALRDAARRLGRPPILALTATATPRVTEDIVNQLDLRDAEVVTTGIARPNLVFEVFPTVNDDAKRARLRALLGETKGVAIVYVATVRAAEALARWLGGEGVRVARYHGRMSKPEREHVQREFMTDAYRVMVATNAFGLGIDKRDVRLVVHYQLPESLEAYYQEAGRAGRDGAPARAVLLYQVEDRRIQRYFLGGRYPRRDESLAVWRALTALGARAQRGVTLADVAAVSPGITERRLRVILAQLTRAGVVERQRACWRRVTDFESAEAFEAFLGQYGGRHEADRDRLETVARYAETTECRVGVIARYFAEPVDADCSRCDNCRARAAGLFRRSVSSASASPKKPDHGEPPAGVQRGDRVTHPEFGPGEVIAVDPEAVTVAFAEAGEKRVDRAYVTPASATGTRGRRRRVERFDQAGRATSTRGTSKSKVSPRAR